MGLSLNLFRHNKLGIKSVEFIQSKICEQVNSDFICFVGVSVVLIDSVNVEVKDRLSVESEITGILCKYVRFVLS